MKSLSAACLLFILCLTLPVLSLGQTDCHKLLKKNINLSSLTEEKLDEIVNDLQELRHCGFDSTFLRLFVTRDILQTTILLSLHPDHGDDITYEHIRNVLLPVQQDRETPLLIERLKVNHELRNKKVDLNNLNHDLQKLYLLEIDTADIAPFHRFLRSEKLEALTYFEAWALFYQKQHPTPPKKPSGYQASFWEVHKDLPLHTLLKRSAAEKKPILLYLSGWNDITSRKLEGDIFHNTSRQQLEERYIIYTLYTDDRGPISDADRQLDAQFCTDATNVGAKNRNIQRHYMPSSKIPCFVILDSDGHKLKSLDGEINRAIFYRFLGIEE